MLGLRINLDKEVYANGKDERLRRFGLKVWLLGGCTPFFYLGPIAPFKFVVASNWMKELFREKLALRKMQHNS